MSTFPSSAGHSTSLQRAANQLTACAEQIHQQIEQQNALARVIDRIRSSLDLDVIFDTTATDIRQLLKADRVGVFRFTPGTGWDEGEFVAEDVVPGFSSAMAARVYDHCFGSQFAAHYAKGRVQAVADIYTASLSDCHVQILEQFQVRANLIVPVLKGLDLWGLLCIHQCSQPRSWQPSEIEFVKQIADHFAIALQQAEYLQHIQLQSTELEQALEQLQRSQVQLIQNEKMASLGQLVAGLAHEINNPINFIYGNLTHIQEYVTDLLTLASFNPSSESQTTHHTAQDHQTQTQEIDLDFIRADLPKTLASMQSGANRIKQIVLSLRNFSRLDEAEIKVVDIHEGIDSTLLILGQRLKANNDQGEIEIIKDYAELPLVECLPAQLNQVFMNLLTNAIDAIHATTKVNSADFDDRQESHAHKIWISTQLSKPGHVKISIRDRGIGIDHNAQLKVFDPFFSTKSVGKGTGLGLTISREIIVEQHAGMLTFNSTPAQGTEFIIELPVKLRHGSPI